jgi:hypothetical protein
MCVEETGGVASGGQGMLQHCAMPRIGAAAVPDFDFCLKHDLDPQRGRRR